MLKIVEFDDVERGVSERGRTGEDLLLSRVQGSTQGGTRMLKGNPTVRDTDPDPSFLCSARPNFLCRSSKLI